MGQSFFRVVHLVGPDQVPAHLKEFWAVCTELRVQDTVGRAAYAELTLLELYLEERRVPTVLDWSHYELRKLP